MSAPNIRVVEKIGLTSPPSVRTTYPFMVHVQIPGVFGGKTLGDHELRREVHEWCTNNLSDNFLVGTWISIFFQTEDDAILFRLKFS